ncbi:nucleoid-associated protein [Dickeya fangzhongdai]|uniref:nucleoid-associated protein n=1 Tax=Dickeya fangzhongdai TaxID=1778540 RepID=UPI0026DF1F93|nr:nucleoid-associated protein [Dickeya fangzhongdai]WKV49539.1 nucleoid-associated protein [Dickeya fangzhongdai]
MAKSITSVLSKGQIESLRIEEFIFHIINTDGDEEKTIFLDSVELTPVQEKFFLDRLKDCAKGTQYVFKENEVDSLQDKCVAYINDTETFIETSKVITKSFAKLHANSAAEGLFVVSKVNYLSSPNEYKSLLFLVKLDKTNTLSYSYEEKNGIKKAVLSQVPNALSESKRAVQKSALVDLSETHVWDVLAYDRVDTELTDYFRNFLGVQARKTPSVMTQDAHKTVRTWARQIDSSRLPDGEDATTLIGRSLSYFESIEEFDTEKFISAVIRHSDPVKKQELHDELYNKLADEGITGSTFKIVPGSISNKDRKTVYETAEGVVITYQGDQKLAGISRKKLPDGREMITIETNKVSIKV